jgi:non-heme chloroperoxidase
MGPKYYTHGPAILRQFGPQAGTLASCRFSLDRGKETADLHEILTIRHVPRMVLVGWSQGAQDVAAYLQQFGTNQLAAVAFIDSPVADGPADLDTNREFVRGLLGRLPGYVEHPEQYATGLAKSLFSKPHPELNIDAIIAQT